MPDLDNPRMQRAMMEMERDMEHLDENNPKHMAHMMRKMKDLMPEGAVHKELDVAIKRLEAGEDPEKIEEDMGDVLGDLMGDEEGGMGGMRGGGGGYTRDAGLYDY
jgi:deoxyadenosine/deoxycytidine kinase